MSTPLLPSNTCFEDDVAGLGISKETASILDDMCFLITAILTYSETNSASASATKLKTTSIWIQSRIASLPASHRPDGNVDHIYESCRIAALIYCRAIVDRVPLSEACTLQDLGFLWQHVWNVDLSDWKKIPAIFLWIMLAALPTAQHWPHGRFSKLMVKGAACHLALDNWDVVDGSLRTFTGLQRWIRKNRALPMLAST